MKLTFFSDTHSKHHDVKDLLGGDITRRSDLKELKDFAEFMASQDYTYKIVIAGNHDFCFEDERSD